MAPSNPGNKPQDEGSSSTPNKPGQTGKAPPPKPGEANREAQTRERAARKGERPIADVDRKVREGDA